MAEIILSKTPMGSLVPVDPAGVELMTKLKIGDGVNVTIKRIRNVKFHRRYFALLNLAYDAWEPESKEYKGEKVLKNFDQFRSDVTILAGYQDVTINIKNEVRVTAKSIKFGSMSQDDFETLYSATINVILSRILTKYKREDLDDLVNKVLDFS